MKMIKIKDDVEMKTLKGYGFRTYDNGWYSKELTDAELRIRPVSREIVLDSYEDELNVIEFLAVLQELINDGLTEIVEIEGE